MRTQYEFEQFKDKVINYVAIYQYSLLDALLLRGYNNTNG